MCAEIGGTEPKVSIDYELIAGPEGKGRKNPI